MDISAYNRKRVEGMRANRSWDERSLWEKTKSAASKIIPGKHERDVFTSGLAGTAEMFGTGIRSAGQVMRTEAESDLQKEDLNAPLRFQYASNKVIGGWYEKIGSALEKKFGNTREKIEKLGNINPEYLSWRKENGEIDFSKMKNVRQWTTGLAQMGGSLAPALAVAAITKNPQAVAVTMGIVEKGDAVKTYSEALAQKRGVDVDKLSQEDIKNIDFYSDIYGIVSGELESIVPARVMNKVGKPVAESFLKRLMWSAPKEGLRDAFAEGGTEGLQRYSQNLIAKESGIKPDQNLSEGVFEEAIVGAIGGKAAGITSTLLSPRVTPVTEEPPTPSLNVSPEQLSLAGRAASNKVISVKEAAGLTPEERDTMKTVLETVSSQPGVNLTNIEASIQALKQSALVEKTGTKIPVTEVKEEAKPTTTPVPATQVQQPTAKVAEKVEKTPVEKPVLPAEKPVTKKEVIEVSPLHAEARKYKSAEDVAQNIKHNFPKLRVNPETESGGSAYITIVDDSVSFKIGDAEIYPIKTTVRISNHKNTSFEYRDQVLSGNIYKHADDAELKGINENIKRDLIKAREKFIKENENSQNTVSVKIALEKAKSQPLQEGGIKTTTPKSGIPQSPLHAEAKNIEKPKVEEVKTLKYPPHKEISEKIKQIATEQGWFARGFSERVLTEGKKMSKGDFERAKISVKKKDLLTIIRNSNEFQENPILTMKDGKLRFEGKTQKFGIVPKALGLSSVKEGTKIKIDKAELTKKDSGQIPKFKKKERAEYHALRDSYDRMAKQWSNTTNKTTRKRISKEMSKIQRQMIKYERVGLNKERISSEMALKVQDLLVDKRFVRNVFQKEILVGAKRDKAWGYQLRDVIAYAKNPSKGTPSHEVGHWIVENVLTEEERAELFSEIRNQIKTKDATDLQIEEKIMEGLEDFADKYINITETSANITLNKKVELLFRKIWERLKALVGMNSKVKEFYIDTLRGKYRTISEVKEQLSTSMAQARPRFKMQGELTTEKGTLRVQKIFESAWEKLYNEKPPIKFSEISDIMLKKATGEQEPTEKEFLEKGYKESFKVGKKVERANQAEKKREIRVKESEKRKTLRSELKKMFKEKTASVQEFKVKAVDYIKTNLPEKIRGKYLIAVKNVRTDKQLQKILDSVDRRRDTYERKLMVSSIEKISDKIEKLPVDIQRTVLDITSQIELKRHTQKLLDRLQRTKEYLDTQANDFGMPRRVLNELGILKRTPFNEISTGKLIAINNKLLQLQNVGQNIMKDVSIRKVKTHMETLADLENGSVNLDKIDPSRKRNPFAADKITRSERAKDWLARSYLTTLGIDRVFNKADGRADYQGINFRTFKEPIDAAWNRWKYVENQISMAFYKMLNDLKLTEENSRRIAIYAYKVQRGGVEKLMEGRDLTKEEIESVNLDEKEMAVYKWMRKRLDELHNSLTEKMEKENNVILGKQEDYFPMMTDYGVTKPLIEEFEAENRLKSVPFGSIKERKSGARQTLKLDAFQTFGSYVGKSTYFIAMDNHIQKLTRLAESDRYRKAVGENMQRVVLTWLDVLARKGGAIVKETPWDVKVNDLNNNLSIAILGLRITTVIKQPLALLDGAAEIGHYAFRGTEKIVDDRWMEFMNENSSEVRERFADPFLEEISHDKQLKKVKKVAMYPIGKLDNLTARSVWAGAYMKKMDELGLEINLKKPNTEALKYADLVMRKTQASPAFKDLPIMMTGKNRKYVKLMMKFQTFILNRWSYIAEDLPDKMKNNKAKAVQQLTFLALATMAEGAINTVYYNMLYGGDNEDKKQTMWRSMISSIVQTVPFVGQVFSSLNYGTNPVPLISVIDKFFVSTRQVAVAKKMTTKEKHAIRALSTALGTIYGIPTDQARQILESLLFPTGKQKTKF